MIKINYRAEKTAKKLAASINFAKVVILVTVAPVKSFPAVVSLTVKSIAEIKPVALLITSFGRGN